MTLIYTSFDAYCRTNNNLTNVNKQNRFESLKYTTVAGAFYVIFVSHI